MTARAAPNGCWPKLLVATAACCLGATLLDHSRRLPGDDRPPASFFEFEARALSEHERLHFAYGPCANPVTCPIAWRTLHAVPFSAKLVCHQCQHKEAERSLESAFGPCAVRRAH